MYLFKWIKNNIKLWSLALLIVPFFLWWLCDAKRDLLWQLVEPAYHEETMIWLWISKETVWRNVFKWSTEVGVDVYLEKKIVTDENGKNVCRFTWCTELCLQKEEDLSSSDRFFCKRQWKYETVETKLGLEAGYEQQPSLIVKVTRMLLILTIVLSVTMILYNGMMYIVKTWQWKEGKDVLKNIAYIIIWILIALFSVLIIRIIQSIPSTLADKNELQANGYELDKAALSQNNKWKSWRTTIATF